MGAFSSVDSLSAYATIACLEAASIWTEVLQGNGEISDAIALIGKVTSADFCGLVRFSKEGSSPLYYGVFSKSAGSLYSGRSFNCVTAELLEEDLHSAIAASVWKQSEIASTSYNANRKPLIDGNNQPLREILSIILENTQQGVVVLELQYRHVPSLASCVIVNTIAPALSRSWLNRLPGAARHQSLRLVGKSEVRSRDRANVPVLTHRNPRGLSRTEFRICMMVRDGMKAATIAASLGVNSKTVRAHLSAIYAKLEVSGQFELLHLLSSEREAVKSNTSA